MNDCTNNNFNGNYNNINSINNNSIQKIMMKIQKWIYFQKNNCFYGSNNIPPYMKKNKKISCELTLCEGRLQNDLAELKRSKIFGKIVEIKFEDNYRKIDDNKLELLIEFVSFLWLNLLLIQIIHVLHLLLLM